ncbi:MAG TPA: PDDEXK nuclease domain-containing protein, partial [Candidatus Wallbacteria bacterium]|nr:PDDEXK nuclease domain-containing protein [Candidatus Wallbacteria bacterium]
LIDEARQSVAITVNAGLTMLYWKIGRRINLEILKGERAEYGAEIVSSLSRQLETEYGRGFSEKSLRRMVQFSTVFPDEQIVAALLRQLNWTHFTIIIPLNDKLKVEFYSEMCRIERWSTRTLREKIDSMLFERTALSTKPEKLAKLELKKLREEDKLTPDLVFRDPYFLDFLGLKDTYQEKDLEMAILREMESFILELGVGFAFMERQKRIIIDGKDYYIDLLFYHRDLRRLIVIELKLGEFKPEHKGQMELYLRYLDKYERHDNEEAPIGLILCAGKKHETIELLDLEKSGIRVSAYWTEVLPKEQLEKKLHEAVRLARQRLEKTGGETGEFK